MTLPLSCRRLSATVLVAAWPLLSGGAVTALAQTQPPPPGQNAAPAQPPPVQNQGANEPNAAPSRPVREQASPNAGTAGYYWYWVVAVIALIVLFWGVPRLMRMLKGRPPGRKS
jgi:hypothetical protein